MSEKFTRVTLDKVLRADADGMPVFRKCFDHEILMSFWDDYGAIKFEEWWSEEGSTLFAKWLSDNEPIAAHCDIV